MVIHISDTYNIYVLMNIHIRYIQYIRCQRRVEMDQPQNIVGLPVLSNQVSLGPYPFPAEDETPTDKTSITLLSSQ